MTSQNKLRLVGVGMCLPLIVYSIYLLMSGKLLSILVPLLLFAVLAHFGVKFIVGKSVAEVTSDATARVVKIDKDVADSTKPS